MQVLKSFTVATLAFCLSLCSASAGSSERHNHEGSAQIAWEYYIHGPRLISPARVSLFLRTSGGVLIMDGSSYAYAVNAGGKLVSETVLGEDSMLTRPDFDGNGRYVICGAGITFCLNQDAQLLWKSESKPLNGTAPLATASFGADGNVYVLEVNGDIV